MFISGKIIAVVASVGVDAHVIGNGKMVVAQLMVNAKNLLAGIFAPGGNASPGSGMNMKIAFLPVISTYLLIGIKNLIAGKRLRFRKMVNRAITGRNAIFMFISG